MTKRIGIGTSLKDFTRRDFLVGSALTAALFTTALVLFPPGGKTESKGLAVPGPVSLPIRAADKLAAPPTPQTGARQ